MAENVPQRAAGNVFVVRGNGHPQLRARAVEKARVAAGLVVDVETSTFESTDTLLWLDDRERRRHRLDGDLDVLHLLLGVEV